MLHVRALSGAPVAELHVDELKAGLKENETLLVLALKRFLGDQLRWSRFRLKLLEENSSKEIDNDATLNACCTPLKTPILETPGTTVWASMRLPGMATWLLCNCC